MKTVSDAMKVHLRVVTVAGATYRVVSLRPATRVQFSDNHYHDTWHVLTGALGAQVLARLLWGLSYQRQPGTLVLIDEPHLVSTPFDGDPALPIAFVPLDLPSIDAGRMRPLVRAVRAMAPTRTLRWQTFGMDRALAAAPEVRYARQSWAETEAQERRERASRMGGAIVMSLPSERLRSLALSVDAARRGAYSTYLPFAESQGKKWTHDGEIQIFGGFDEDVAAARVARREVLGDRRAIVDDGERMAVYVQKLDVDDRRRDARKASARRRSRARRRFIGHHGADAGSARDRAAAARADRADGAPRA
jgi:hypothetical protein